MRFRKFTLDPKDSDEQHCNSRIWRTEQELYCEGTPVAAGKRCVLHMPPEPKSAEEEVLTLLNTEKIAQRVDKLKGDRRNITELDDEILRLAAIIDETEDHYDSILNPILKTEIADLLAKMKKTKAEIIEKRVNIEIKLRLVLDADLLWGRIADIFERTIVDENSRRMAKIEIGKLLDELVNDKKAKES